MTLSRWGFREWGGSLAVASAISVCLLDSGHGGWIPPVAFLWLALAAFFRQPVRTPTLRGDDILIAPADGTISAIERMPHPSLGPDSPDAMVVRIFLSVLNVHTNRSPCAARVVAIAHQDGQYLDARSPESARVNERVDVTLQRPDGLVLGIRQIAGAIARRIICQLTPGDTLRQGETWGLIKFGSTTELVLPAETLCDVLVKVGDAVRGGETPIVRLLGPDQAARD